ncbi:hypothetical protein EOM89_11590 [Candidatus Falkowbacteria bacterium]|nr:hypothetical protein [Gammaproteobacteria bacterium]NCU21336.1 hypothetical protein [Candidatus Falkowbacteria bacterium]
MNDHYDKLLERLAATVPAAGRLSRGDLYDLVRAVEVLAIERPNPDGLWTLHRAATYLGLDPTAAERLLRTADAPRPMTAPDDPPIWRARDIYRWLDQHRPHALRAVA